MADANQPKHANAQALAALQRLGTSSENPPAPRTPRSTPSGEIPLARPTPTTLKRPMPSPPPPRAPRWYRLAAPILFAIGGALMIIGLWAVGALAYMRTTTPTTPDFQSQYPLIRWSPTVGENGGYTDDSKMMAMAMVACIPVAALMGAMVMVMRRQIRAAQAHSADR
jgi:hypothetical protein